MLLLGLVNGIDLVRSMEHRKDPESVSNNVLLRKGHVRVDNVEARALEVLITIQKTSLRRMAIII